MSSVCEFWVAQDGPGMQFASSGQLWWHSLLLEAFNQRSLNPNVSGLAGALPGGPLGGAGPVGLQNHLGWATET